MASRYKGLTTDQQNRLLVALREDTLVKAGGGYPARQPEIGTPSDGQATKYWADAGDARAFFERRDADPTYRSSPGGLEFRASSNQRMEGAEDYSNTNLGYWSRLHNGSLTIAARLQVDTVPSSAVYVFATDDADSGTADDDKASMRLIYRDSTDGDADFFFNWEKSGGETGTLGLGPAGAEEFSAGEIVDVFVEVDVSGGTNTARLVVNGTEVDTDSGFSTVSGTPSQTPRINQSNRAGDFTLQGVAVDTEAGHGADLIDWVKGNNYTTSTTSSGSTHNLTGSPHQRSRDPAIIWGARIEGIGEQGADSNNAQKQLLFCSTSAQGHEKRLRNQQSPAINFEPIPVLKANRLPNPKTSQEFFEAKNRWARVNLPMRATDFVATKFLGRATRADFVTEADLSASATSTIETDATGGELENDVIYIHNETIKLGSHNGSGQYDINTRGAFLSQARKHKSGSNIFTTPPYWTGRRVLWQTIHIGGGPDFEDDGTTQASSLDIETRVEARIAAGVRQSKGEITLPTTELVQAYSDFQGGRENRAPKEVDGRIALLTDGGATVVVNRGNLTYADSEGPSIVKSDTGHSHQSSTAFDLAFQVHNQVVPAAATKDSNNDYDTVWLPNGKNRFDGTFDDKHLDNNGGLAGGRFDESDQVNEVLCVDRNGDDQPITPLFSVWQEIGERIFGFHPLALYAAIHFSTPQDTTDPANFDVFQSDWSLNMRDQFESSAESNIKDLIRATPWAKMDRLILGWNNKAVALRDVALNRLVRPFGFFEGINDDGELFVDRVRVPDIEDINEARNNKLRIQVPSQVLDEDSGQGQTTDTIKVQLGSTPITDGETHWITARDPEKESIRAGRIQSKPDMTLNLNTIDPDRRQEIRRKIIGRALFQHFELPRLTARFDDYRQTGNSYGIGDLAQLDDLPIEPAWFVDKSQTRVNTAGSKAEFAGFITMRKLIASEQEGALSYELRLVLAGDTPPRLRAPSGVVKSVTTNSGDHIITFKGGSDDTEFGDTQSDASRFSASSSDGSDDVEVWNEDGTRWIDNEVKEIKSVDGNNNEITINGTWDSDPPEDSIIELAHVDTDDSGTGYTNDGLSGTYANVDRVYCYMGEDDLTLGDADATADEYGA